MDDDHAIVWISAAKMDDIGLFAGDTVLLKGKRKKNTVALVYTDESVSDNRIRMGKLIRSNLR